MRHLHLPQFLVVRSPGSPSWWGSGLTGWSRVPARTELSPETRSSEITQAVGRAQSLRSCFLSGEAGVTLSKQRLPRGPPHRALFRRGSWWCLQSQPGPLSVCSSGLCVKWLIRGVTVPPESQSHHARSRERTGQWGSVGHPRLCWVWSEIGFRLS